LPRIFIGQERGKFHPRRNPLGPKLRFFCFSPTQGLRVFLTPLVNALLLPLCHLKSSRVRLRSPFVCGFDMFNLWDATQFTCQVVPFFRPTCTKVSQIFGSRSDHLPPPGPAPLPLSLFSFRNCVNLRNFQRLADMRPADRSFHPTSSISTQSCLPQDDAPPYCDPSFAVLSVLALLAELPRCVSEGYRRASIPSFSPAGADDFVTVPLAPPPFPARAPAHDGSPFYCSFTSSPLFLHLFKNTVLPVLGCPL